MPNDFDVYGNRTYGFLNQTPGGSRNRGAFSGPTGTRASGGFGVPLSSPAGSRTRSGFENQQDEPVPTGGGPQSVSNLTTPGDITNALNGTPPAVPTSRSAPTTAQVNENPGQWAGTSFDPNRSIGYTYDPGGANSMPQGSEVINGVAQYTGSNGPLDTTRFTPAPAPQQPRLTPAQQAEQDVQSLASRVRERYPELTFMNFLSGNPNRGGFSITDPSTQAHYASAWGRPLNTALLGEASLQNAAGSSNYDPFAIRTALQRYL